ncbi:response regulator [Shewanella submarina]|uniref:Response regulator transcription factor n=1 Tax=Shewanella submarina TaxID=2016376 RepID=A0ABV7GKS5_9GAMM|nr:response regulator [Shewanella submarina]MCL1038077.1 response regulator [Shewanella submarina]
MNSPNIDNVYLVDDDQDVLESLSWMLEGLGIQPACYQSADAFLTQTDIHQAGVAVLDINMPGMDGMELLETLKQRNSPIRVIMLTGQGTIALAVKSIQFGALDFLEKPVDGDKLLTLLEQGIKQSQELAESLVHKTQITTRLESLTRREKEVLSGILDGKMNKVIAAELGIAQRTIELHRQKVMSKMSAGSVAELTSMINAVH